MGRLWPWMKSVLVFVCIVFIRYDVNNGDYRKALLSLMMYSKVSHENFNL